MFQTFYSPHRGSVGRSAGFTMVEVLVTVAIIAGLTAISLPTVKEALRSNMISSAANVVAGAMINARAMAIQREQRYGVQFERRSRELTGGGTDVNQVYPLFSLAAAGDRDEAWFFGGTNYASRIFYTQSPQDYLQEKVAYSFATLTDVTENCQKRYGYFIPSSSAGLLFAAAEGRRNARRLISPGTVIRIGRRSAPRISKIEAMIPVGVGKPSADLYDLIAAYDIGSGPPNCEPQIEKPPTKALAPSWMTEEGTVIFTSDQYVRDPTRAGDLAFDAGSLSNLGDQAPVEVSIELNPVRAPFAPVALPGKAAVDLSISGRRGDPLQFGIEGIVSGGDHSTSAPGVLKPAPTAAPNEMHDVVIIFAANGSVESVYVDELDSTGRFQLQRYDPPPSISLLVGYSDGVLESVQSLAVVPTALEIPPGDLARIETMGIELNPRQTPNFTNGECSWVTVMGQSGAIRIDPVGESVAGGLNGPYADVAPANAGLESAMADRMSVSRGILYSGNQ